MIQALTGILSARLGAPLLLAFALLAAPAWAQSTQVTTRVRPESPVLNNVFQLSLTVEHDGRSRISSPILPEVPGTRLVRNVSTTSQKQLIVNGRLTASTTFSWTLLATTLGPIQIPAIEVQVGERTYASAPSTIEVRNGQTFEPGGQTGPPPLFLDASLSQEQVYVGQPISLEILLGYAQVNVSGFDWEFRPAFSEFWTSTEDFEPTEEQYNSTIRGVEYSVIPLERRTLIPTSPGRFKVEPYVGRVSVRVNSRRRRMDIFSFSRNQVENVASPPKQIEVLQLPVTGRPENFGGAVGQFSVKASFDRETANSDDALALRVTVEGTGSLRSVSAPVFTAPVDLEVFDPEVKGSTFRRSGNRFRTSKSWEWLVVPVAPGEFNLPPIEFHYFDPESASYKTVSAELPTLRVDAGEGRPDVATAPRLLQSGRNELHFIKHLDRPLASRGLRVHERPWFLTLLIAPLFVAPLFIIWQRRRVRLSQDQGRTRLRRARPAALRNLKLIRKNIDQSDSATFHEGIAKTLVEYVADRFNRSGAGLTYDAADALLRSRSVDPELCRRFRATLEQCDFARFVPSAGASERRNELLGEAALLIDDLERALK